MFFQLTAAVNCPRQTNNAIRPRTVTNCLENDVHPLDLAKITGHRSVLTFRNYDHRSIQHKLDEADYINNIKDSDAEFGPPKELLLNKNPSNSNAIAQKSAPFKSDSKDMSREALKRYWDSKKEPSIGIISCQPGGSSDSTVIVAEATVAGLKFVKKQVVEKEVNENNITKVVEKEVKEKEVDENKIKKVVETVKVKEKEVQKDELNEVHDDDNDLSIEELCTQQDTQWEKNPNFGTAPPEKKPKKDVKSRDGENIKSI